VKVVGYIFDLDGTIYRGNRVTPGACQSVQILRKRGREIVFLSNKPLFSRKAYAEKLCALGIPAQEDEVITSSWVLARELAKEAPEAKVFAIGETPLLDELTRAGLTLHRRPGGNRICDCGV
jgi:arabinose operon protein AraL